VKDCNVELLLVEFSRVLLVIAVRAGGGRDDKDEGEEPFDP
jgi:hypothetical protein